MDERLRAKKVTGVEGSISRTMRRYEIEDTF
jgi:hypothetical protein